MPTIASMFKKQGREEGIEQGIKKGSEVEIEERRERLVKGILMLMQSKFQNLPMSIEEKITSVRDLSTLETLMEQAIESESIVQFQQKMESI